MRRIFPVFAFAALMLTLSGRLCAQPAAVDMGLSVKWADCNLGATAPEGYGCYYAWAETNVKEEYSWDTYTQGDGTWGGFSKYNDRFKLNYQADPADDAVAVKLGDGWRMPTFTEMNELVHNCTWEWTSLNGVAGYRVTSEKNGASIFLPAAGYMDGSELQYAGSAGRYWSATRHPYHPHCAMQLFFSEEHYYAYFYRRYRGFTIRPVKD